MIAARTRVAPVAPSLGRTIPGRTIPPTLLVVVYVVGRNHA